jgi:hypothetical protein
MNKTMIGGALFTFAVAAIGGPTPTLAQANPAHTHVGHVTSGFPAAPDGQGLLPTALAEARTAAQHAELAARDLANLEAMKQHVGHVLHALDPDEASQGPGAGFGVRRAAEGIAQHIGLAAGSDGASQNVSTHGGHVAAAARTVAQRAEEAIEVAKGVQAAGTAAEAAPLVERLRTLTGELIAGRDANDDGRITWEEGEGGLEHVEQHMGLLARGEGL